MASCTVTVVSGIPGVRKLDDHLPNIKHDTSDSSSAHKTDIFFNSHIFNVDVDPPRATETPGIRLSTALWPMFCESVLVDHDQVLYLIDCQTKPAPQVWIQVSLGHYVPHLQQFLTL